MIASLGMYELSGMAGANDRLWALIRDGLRARGIAAPDGLTRGEVAYWDAWQSPDLVLSQTCGFPYRARLHDKVTLIGTPDYGLPGCPPGHYCSVFVARKDDPRVTLDQFDGTALAYNEPLSQSGWAAPQIMPPPMACISRRACRPAGTGCLPQPSPAGRPTLPRSMR